MGSRRRGDIASIIIYIFGGADSSLLFSSHLIGSHFLKVSAIFHKNHTLAMSHDTSLFFLSGQTVKQDSQSASGGYNQITRILFRHRSICGEDAAKFIDTRYAHYYFASATGISLENGVNTLTSMDVEVKRAMNRNAEKTVLLMDHSKIGRSHFYKAFDISDIDILISDQALPKRLEDRCRQEKVEIITP